MQRQGLQGCLRAWRDPLLHEEPTQQQLTYLVMLLPRIFEYVRTGRQHCVRGSRFADFLNMLTSRLSDALVAHEDSEDSADGL